MKAAIYCRVSTEDQEREGTILQSKLEACQRKTRQREFETTNDCTFLETYSGLTLSILKLESLRQLVASRQVDAVIAYTLDRLSRDPVHFIILQEEIQRAGAELILVTEYIYDSDIGRLITHIKGFTAKLRNLYRMN